MSIEGFIINGQVVKYDYDELADKPSIPSAVTVDSALSDSSTNPVQNKVITGELDDIKNALKQNYANFIDIEQGYWAIADGSATSSTQWCRTKKFINKELTIRTTTSYMWLNAFNKLTGAYVGTWNGSAFNTTYNSSLDLREYNISEFVKNYPDYVFTIDFKKASGNLTPTNVYSELTVENNLQSDIDTLNSIGLYVNTDSSVWAEGYWAIADGTYSSSGSWSRTSQILDDSVVYIETAPPYKIFLVAYDGDTYIGTWFGSSFSKTYDAAYLCRHINLQEFREKYPTYTFKLDVTKTSGTAKPADVFLNVKLYKSRSIENSTKIQEIYGDIVNKSLWENGTINSNGVKGWANNEGPYRLSTHSFLRFAIPVTIIPKSGYVFSVTTYTLDKTFESQFSAWSNVPFTFSRPDRLYKIVIKASASNTKVIPENVSNYISAVSAQATPYDRILSEFANVKAVNHRGYNVIAPENTIPAYKMSADFGYKYVETDVLFTSDGVPVLMHDDTINRTCCNASDGSSIGSTISIESISYDDLITNYDACTPSQYSKYAGVKVPTFEEFMYCCKVYNLHPWIELKWTHTYTLSEIQLIISIIKKYGMEENVSFISFSYDALALVASEWDTVELGLNGTIADATLLKTGKNRVFMIYNQNTSYSDAINAGFQVCVYTVNTTAELSALSNQGFDSILTNGLLPNQVYNTVRAKFESA